MPTNAKPAATSQTKPNNAKGATNVAVTSKRKVTYVFHATSANGLRIPYAVAVNGKVLPEFAKGTRKISGSGGKISLVVDSGSTVTLYLNSDAHPSYRQNPVYAITPNAKDVEISITEKKGKHSDSDTPVLAANPAQKVAAPPPTVDKYTAPLTGDIWMKVSHKYTAAEVDTLLPSGTSTAVISAVKRIYNGLATADLTLTIPAGDGKPTRNIHVVFSDSDNPNQNITSYTLLGEGLPRVHPAGYAALFSAAVAADVTSLTLSSCWRPMLGSIAHRAGLGLDVSILGTVKINRQELRQGIKTGKGNRNDNDNVTDAEVADFKDYEDAIKEAKKSDAAATAATKRCNDLMAARKKIPLSDTAKLEAIDAEIAKAAQAKSQAIKVAGEAEAARAASAETWNQERNKHEPDSVKTYRVSLLECSCVSQLFDPWFMDGNTHDSDKPVPNTQVSPNETLHAHHLHITVQEPNIL